MTNPSSFQVTAPASLAEGNEFNFRGLYLYHTYSGPNSSQTTIISHRAMGGPMGTMAVNNWVVREGLGPNAKVVARAQGLHIYAGNWHNSFSLVFEDKRFKGSTLQVMGVPVEGGEWAIVGGTGQFAMATGVIQKRVRGRNGQGNVVELTIHGFCPLLKRSRTLPTKLGTWGGNGGSARDIVEPPKRLESITVRSGSAVDSIAFSYIGQDAQKHNAGPWGGPGGKPTTIQLASSEYVKEISGTFGVFNGLTVVTSLKLVTNVKMYGPLGKDKGTPFSVPVQGGRGVAGFFARSGLYLDALGIYLSE